jgi:hypothetical protein
VENNEIQESRGFIQVQASVMVKTLLPVCIGCIMIAWVETPSDKDTTMTVFGICPNLSQH